MTRPRAARPPQSARAAVWIALCALFAVAVCLPALRVGLYADDWVGVALDRGEPIGMASRFDLYRFSTGEPAAVQRLIDAGSVPWWTNPRMKFSLFRPLSSAVYALDFAALGADPARAHAHSLAWLALLVAVVGRLLQRLVPGAVAALALLAFALDAAHATPIGWLCTRYVLVVAVPVVVALDAHVRYREDGWRVGRAVAPLALALGLAAGELALQGVALLAAYEVLGARDGRAARARAFAPFALLAAVYVFGYAASGRGVHAVGSYADPFAEPARFAARAAGVLGVLLAEQLLRVDAMAVEPARSAWVAAAGFGALAATGALLRAALSALPSEHARHLRWLAAGSLLALAPALAGSPDGRLLYVPGVGAAAVVAAILLVGARAVARGQRAWLVPIVAAAAVHLVVSPIALVRRLAAWRVRAAREASLFRDAEVGTDAARADVIVLVAPDHGACIWGGAARATLTGARARSWWCASALPVPHVLVRTGVDRFELIAASVPPRVADPLGAVAPGARVRAGWRAVRVLAAGASTPTHIEVRIDRSLDDASLRWVSYERGALRRVAMPPVGGRLALGPSPGERGVESLER